MNFYRPVGAARAESLGPSAGRTGREKPRRSRIVKIDVDDNPGAGGPLRGAVRCRALLVFKEGKSDGEDRKGVVQQVTPQGHARPVAGRQLFRLN